MPPSALHLLQIEGGNALSAFRVRALLALLRSSCPRIAAVAARHVHWAAFDAAPKPGQLDKLHALLAYGGPYPGPIGPIGTTGTTGSARATESELVVVLPRLGTVSPWASKASDIARNCGLEVHRIERVTEYRLTLKSGLFGVVEPLTAEERGAMAYTDESTSKVKWSNLNWLNIQL